MMRFNAFLSLGVGVALCLFFTSVHAMGTQECGEGVCEKSRPKPLQYGLAAPVLPTSPKAVTRFSSGASNLRQQVQLQTNGNQN